ncbi:MAG: histidinol-phosphate transaminase [Succinivibrio sp.]|nr:histidinol-phosphate transaminase [Succinivibrio sp.]
MTSYAELANGGLTRIKPYQAGKPIEEVKRELGIDDVIKLASNECPLGMSPKAREAAIRAVEEGNFYPDSNGFYLKEKLCRRYGYDREMLTLGAGSNELINLLFEAFVNDRCNVVLPAYSFVVYAMEATVNAAPVKSVPLKNWQVDLDACLAAIDENTRVVAFANPSNPIGTAVSYARIHEFVRQVPKRTLVVIDEAYNEFNSGDPTYEDTAKWVADCENLVVSRTFSKAYGLAGLRVGYMVANPEISSLLNRLRAPFNVNSVALSAACAALDDQDFLQQVVNNNNTERERFGSFCREQGLEMIPSLANFVTIDFGQRDAQKLAADLLKRGVIVRPLVGYQLLSKLRVSIGTPEQNDRFFKALTELLGQA